MFSLLLSGSSSGGRSFAHDGQAAFNKMLSIISGQISFMRNTVILHIFNMDVTFWDIAMYGVIISVIFELVYRIFWE